MTVSSVTSFVRQVMQLSSLLHSSGRRSMPSSVRAGLLGNLAHRSSWCIIRIENQGICDRRWQCWRYGFTKCATLYSRLHLFPGQMALAVCALTTARTWPKIVYQALFYPVVSTNAESSTYKAYFEQPLTLHSTAPLGVCSISMATMTKFLLMIQANRQTATPT